MIDTYIYLKLCWSEAMGHLSIPITIFDKAIIISLFLKIFGINNYWVVGLCGVAVLGFMLFLGHLAVKMGLTAKQMSLANKYNPEIQRILNK